MDTQAVKQFCQQHTDASVVPALMDYMRVPNQSPAFDADWATNGLQEQALQVITGWIDAQEVQGLAYRVVTKDGLTPLLIVEIASFQCDSDDSVLMYGHFDKQPPLDQSLWNDGLSPHEPVLKDGKLYGRGGADDGYSIFAAITAITAVQKHGGSHKRIVILCESAEESAREDLDIYLRQDDVKSQVGTPSLIVCLDSGAGNYDQMWLTSSLRGAVAGNLQIDVLTEGVHSGSASGIVPSSFRILRQLLARLEDTQTGEVHEKFQVEIPSEHLEYARDTVATLGEALTRDFPWRESTRPVSSELLQLQLNRTWRPTLCVTGMDGAPSCLAAGNVLRPRTTAKFSIRMPPTLKGDDAVRALNELLVEAKAPYHCHVSLHNVGYGEGWCMPPLPHWLRRSVDAASENFFGLPPRFLAEGVSIPLMGELATLFPKASFVVTGVLGPQSNAHGPNEMLHVPFLARLTACVAQVLNDHARQ